MKISVLVDNTPGVNTLAEFGLSYFIDYEGKQILFDTAQSDLFLRNAKIMNLDTKNVDQIVLSHGHFDHGNGLNHINGGNLICHSGCFVKRYRKNDHTYIGLKNSRDDFEKKFNLITTKDPYQIFDGAYFLGEIPRITDFESQTTPFVLDDGTPDFVMDDSALAFKVENGIFVITGCGHSGIVNTLEHAKKVTGENKITGVMGGFHLKENNLQTQKTIAYLKDNNAKHVYPSHCTALPALAEFYKVFKTKQIKTGDIITID
jgi:7,8-dihydropterin-6-yl-methyl-4-(beta-D-ribofuranosyl)aminobenzene 5'-phosphate synthase